MYIKDYIQATHEVLGKTKDSGAVLASLKKYLERRGLTKLYPAILRGLIERNRRSEKSAIPKVTLARTSDFEAHKQEILSSLTKIQEDTTHHIHIDETIIGGYIVQTKDQRIDKSYKNKLLHTYRSLID